MRIIPVTVPMGSKILYCRSVVCGNRMILYGKRGEEWRN